MRGKIYPKNINETANPSLCLVRGETRLSVCRAECGAPKMLIYRPISRLDVPGDSKYHLVGKPHSRIEVCIQVGASVVTLLLIIDTRTWIITSNRGAVMQSIEHVIVCQWSGALLCRKPSLSTFKQPSCRAAGESPPGH